MANDITYNLSLTDFFISPPLAALYTIVLGLSMCIVFDETGKTLFHRNELWVRALYFFTGLLITAWIIWLFAMLHFITQYLLIAIAGAFIIPAFFIVFKNRRRLLFTDIWNRLRVESHAAFTNRLLQYAGWLVLIIFFTTSLAPATDADSLDYHLGAPVEILQNGSLWFNKDYLHFRLTGFGEMINLLGVANGCIQLGSFLQVMALVWLLAIYIDKITVSKTHIYTLLLGLPVLLFFISGQKNQLTGIVATSVCFYALAFEKKAITKWVPLLLVCTILFAVGIKYSFIISAAVLVFYMLWNAGEFITGKFILSFLALAILFLGPLFLYKYLLFSDPVSPLAERFKSNPDKVIVGFYKSLQQFSEQGYKFPLKLFLPSSAGTISTILGIGAVLIIASITLYRQYYKEIVTVLLFTILVIVGGQKTSRFFIEPFFWMLPPVLLSYQSKKWIKYLVKVGDLQFLIMLPFILYSGYLLSPGILSGSLREKLLQNSSMGYQDVQWLKKVLPPDANIATNLRSRAYFAWNYFPKEYLHLSLRDSLRSKRQDTMMKIYGINYFVWVGNTDKMNKRYNAELFAGPVEFLSATRNPYNRKRYTLAVYKIK